MISLISLFLLLGMSTVSAASDADVIAQDMSIDDVSVIGDVDNNLNDETLSEGEENVPDEPGTGDGSEEGEDNPVEDSINTTIDAKDDHEFSYGDTIKINYTLKDNESNPINDTNKSNFIVYYKNSTDVDGEFNTTVGFSINNESQIVLNQLGVGDYLINIQFLNSTIGDKNYTESNKTINLKINKTGTRFVADVAVVQIDEEVIIPFKIYIDCNKTLNVNASRLNVTVNGEEYSFTNITGGNNVTNGIKLTNFTKNGTGNYIINITYNGTDNCERSEIAFELHIVENNTITANDTFKVNDSNRTITIPFSITNSEIITVEDEETGENKTINNVTNLNVTKGNLTLILSYDNGIENVTVNIDSEEFTLIDNEGNYSIELTVPIDFNTTLYKAQLVIIYANDSLNETNKTINLVAFKEVSVKPVGNEADYQFGNFTFKLVDANNETIAIANENVTLSGFWFYSITERGTSISTSKSFITDESGTFVFNDTMLSLNIDQIALYYNFTSLPAGTYNATFATSGFYQVIGKNNITVNPIEARIIAENLTGEYGNLLHYTFQLFSDKYNAPIKFANVQFMINASNINAVRDGVTNETGWYTSPDLNLTANVYNLTLKTTGDSLNCSDAKAKLNVTQRDATVTASNRTIYYNSDYAAIVKLKDKKTGKAVANAYVWIRIYTGSKYTDFIGKTNKNGNVYVSTPLSVGKHKIVYQSIDNNYKSGQITRYLTVKTAPAKFSAPKVSTYYKSGRVFKIKLINTKTNKPIHSGKMNIKLYISKNKYYNYTGVSDAKGFVQFKATLKPGTYKVVVSDYDKGYTAKAVTSQIKVSKSPIKIAPTALKVKKGKYFKVKVTSTKSKKVLSAVKVKVRVYTGKKYKTYTIKTNKKGIASLKIKQKVGKHKVVLTPYQTKYYTAKKVTKTLKVVK